MWSVGWAVKGGEASLVVGIALAQNTRAQVLFMLSPFLVVQTILLDLFLYL